VRIFSSKGEKRKKSKNLVPRGKKPFFLFRGIFFNGTVANRRGSSEKGVEIFEDFCEHEWVSNCNFGRFVADGCVPGNAGMTQEVIGMRR